MITTLEMGPLNNQDEETNMMWETLSSYKSNIPTTHILVYIQQTKIGPCGPHANT